MKAVKAEILPTTSAEDGKHKAAVTVHITQNSPVFGDLDATERAAVLAAVVTAVRGALPDYQCPATVTSAETTAA